ncbi:MAG: response regulator [Acidobacteriia bacterium]|nr:response regulator [Terriglobia bacterium]
MSLVSLTEESVPDGLIGDAGRLRQILINLVGNAMKFTEQGEIKLVVTPEEMGKDRARIRFSVSDTGIGIPKDQLARIFGAFEQADPSIHRKYGGTGLGLAISSRLVSLMSGRIWAESELGRGSTFHFHAEFPYAEQAAAQPEKIEASGEGSVRQLRILVAEDHPVNQRVIQKLLNIRGHSVTLVPDGEAAVDQWAPGYFDLVLMDLQMPRLDGLQAARAIRAREQDSAAQSRVPIYALSAKAFPEDARECLSAGMDGHLTKPITADALDKVLASVG